MRSPVLAGIIGALRAWTVAMISAFDSLQIDRRDPEVCVTQLPLDDVGRGALVGELDGVSMAQLVGGEAAPHAGLGGDAPQLGAG
jgi:hypothetical protein